MCIGGRSRGGGGSRGSRKSSIASFFRSMRGLRYAFRLLTGKRMGFSLPGPAGMRLHYNSDGSLRSMSLKSCAGMRAIIGSDGRFKGLSIPGPIKGTRIFTNKSGELTGFGLPRLFGGFLLYDAHGNLKRTYGPVTNGTCLSYDADGNKKKHQIEKTDEKSFFEKEFKQELPGTDKTYSKEGEVTDKGIIPVSDSDLKKFTVKETKPEQNKKSKTEKKANVNSAVRIDKKEQEIKPKQMSISDVTFDTGSEGSQKHTEEPRSTVSRSDDKADTEMPLADESVVGHEMDETYKKLDEVSKDRDAISFDELF